MKASELVRELQDAIRLYGDLPVRYDEDCEIVGAVPYHWRWNRHFNGDPECLILNQHEAASSYVGPLESLDPHTRSMIEAIQEILAKPSPFNALLEGGTFEVV